MPEFLQRLLCCSVLFILPLLAAHLWEIKFGKRYIAVSRKRLWIIMFSHLFLVFVPIPATVQSSLQQLNQSVNASLSLIPASNSILSAIYIPYNSINSAYFEVSKQLVVPTFSTILTGVWCTGALIIASIFLVKYICFTRFVTRRSTPEQNPEILNLFYQRKSEMHMHGLNKRVILQRCVGIASPLICGFIRPRILLPEVVYSTEELDAVICHELTHCKLCDQWVGILQTLSKTIYWFHPLVWKASTWMDAAVECACDEMVTKNRDSLWRKQYATTLVLLLQKKDETSPLFSKGFSSNIAERIDVILNRSSRKKGGITILSIFAVLALCCAIIFAPISVSAIEPEGGVSVEAVQEKQIDGKPASSEVLDGEEKASISPKAKVKIEQPVGGIPLKVTGVEKTLIFETKEINSVYAIFDGVVVYSDIKGYMGHHILVKQKDGYIASYSNLSREHSDGIVSVGQAVSAGELIGYTGASGRAEGGKRIVTLMLYKDNSLYDINSALDAALIKIYLKGGCGE